MDRKLSELNINQIGLIKKIHSSGLEESIQQEFREQGFLPNTEIRILKFYPSQKKWIVSLNDTITIALPDELAHRILVETQGDKQ